MLLARFPGTLSLKVLGLVISMRSPQISSPKTQQATWSPVVIGNLGQAYVLIYPTVGGRRKTDVN